MTDAGAEISGKRYRNSPKETHRHLRDEASDLGHDAQ